MRLRSRRPCSKRRPGLARSIFWSTTQGQASSQPFAKTDAALWQQMLSVNLTGTYHCIQAVLPGMLEAASAAGGGTPGRIVNIASTAGLKGYAYVSAYVAAKHGVVGLTKTLALELARKGVTVNAICPGYTETDIVREAVHNIMQKTGKSEAEAQQGLGRQQPAAALGAAARGRAKRVVVVCRGQRLR